MDADIVFPADRSGYDIGVCFTGDVFEPYCGTCNSCLNTDHSAGFLTCDCGCISMEINHIDDWYLIGRDPSDTYWSETFFRRDLFNFITRWVGRDDFELGLAF